MCCGSGNTTAGEGGICPVCGNRTHKTLDDLFVCINPNCGFEGYDSEM